jgi:hypothetical protein
MKFPMPSCRDVAGIILAREDRHLSFGERLTLHMHLAVCKACPGFERRVLFMRGAMARWREHPGAGSVDVE